MLAQWTMCSVFTDLASDRCDSLRRAFLVFYQRNVFQKLSPGETIEEINLKAVVERARQCRPRRLRQGVRTRQAVVPARTSNAAWGGESGAGECVAHLPNR